MLFYVGHVNFILVPMFVNLSRFWKLIFSSKSSQITVVYHVLSLNFKCSCIFEIQTYNSERSFFGVGTERWISSSY